MVYYVNVASVNIIKNKCTLHIKVCKCEVRPASAKYMTVEMKKT